MALCLGAGTVGASPAAAAVFEWADPFSFEPGVGYMEVPSRVGYTGPPNPPPNVGTARPFPAQMKVFGLPGRVLSLRVGFTGLLHTGANDVDALLVGPGGQQSMLISDACGAGLIQVEFLTFDDRAAGPPPKDSTCAEGAYRPANYASGTPMFPLFFDDMPSPAPPPASGGGLDIYPSQLSAFAGTDPNGLWRLFMVDDGASGNLGGVGLLGDWALDVRIPTRCRGRPATIHGVDRRGDNLIGTRKRDVIQAFGGPDDLIGKRGRDLLCGGKGRDSLFGGAGRDVLVGGPKRDKLNGGAGRDRVIGGPGPDMLLGGKGRDFCIGGGGRDVAIGCERRRGI